MMASTRGRTRALAPSGAARIATTPRRSARMLSARGPISTWSSAITPYYLGSAVENYDQKRQAREKTGVHDGVRRLSRLQYNPQIAVVTADLTGPSPEDATVGTQAMRRAGAWLGSAGAFQSPRSRSSPAITPIEQRPALRAALDALRAHGAGVLVVARRDRVACDVVLAGRIETGGRR